MSVTSELCAGCGRSIGPGDVACPGCGRPLGRGGEVPPGWAVAPGTASPAIALSAADGPARGASSPPPADPFRPAGVGAPGTSGEEPPRPAYVLGGPNWRLRPRVAPGAAAAQSTMPRVAFTRPVAAAAPRRSARVLFWSLVGAILATSAAALVILAVHVVRHH